MHIFFYRTNPRLTSKATNIFSTSVKLSLRSKDAGMVPATLGCMQAFFFHPWELRESSRQATLSCRTNEKVGQVLNFSSDVECFLPSLILVFLRAGRRGRRIFGRLAISKLSYEPRFFERVLRYQKVQSCPLKDLRARSR